MSDTSPVQQLELALSKALFWATALPSGAVVDGCINTLTEHVEPVMAAFRLLENHHHRPGGAGRQLRLVDEP